MIRPCKAIEGIQIVRGYLENQLFIDNILDDTGDASTVEKQIKVLDFVLQELEQID